MNSVKHDAVMKAAESRHALIHLLDEKPLGDPIWAAIAAALIDYRILGYLSGLETGCDTSELQGYERGYMDGYNDRIKQL